MRPRGFALQVDKTLFVHVASLQAETSIVFVAGVAQTADALNAAAWFLSARGRFVVADLDLVAGRRGHPPHDEERRCFAHVLFFPFFVFGPAPKCSIEWYTGLEVEERHLDLVVFLTADGEGSVFGVVYEARRHGVHIPDERHLGSVDRDAQELDVLPNLSDRLQAHHVERKCFCGFAFVPA